MDQNVRQHLFEMSFMTCNPPPDHMNYLTKLKKSGFEPKVIYDIGACVTQWTKAAKQFWPDAKYILFDAYDKAEFLYENYDYHIGVLGSENNKTVKFYTSDVHPGGNSYYREIGGAPNTFPENCYTERVTKTLDTVVAERGFPLPDLVKIDVQGAEKDVIAGGLNTILNCEHLIVEMQHNDYNEGAPKVNVTLPYIESLGFKCIAPLFCDHGSDGDYGFIKENVQL